MYLSKTDRQDILIELDSVNFYHPEFNVDLYMNDVLKYSCPANIKKGKKVLHETPIGDWLILTYKGGIVHKRYSIPCELKDSNIVYSMFFVENGKKDSVNITYGRYEFDNKGIFENNPFVVTKIKSITKDLSAFFPAENYNWGIPSFTDDHIRLYPDVNVWEYYHSFKRDSIVLVNATDFVDRDTVFPFQYNYMIRADFFNRFRSSFYVNLKFKIRSVDMNRNHFAIAERLLRFKGFLLNSKDKKGITTTITFHHRNDPLVFMTLDPEPDVRTTAIIQYNDSSKIRTILEHGITMYGEKISDKDRNERINFILATLIGICCSILAEIALKKWTH